MASEATWPTEFADFKRLDAVLKCGICYDYMTNCMITSCSHTYCSLCIRKFMQYKNQCPACFEETYEVHLRNNRPLDEVISIFVKMKDKLQRALRLATIPIPIKEAKIETKEDHKVLHKTPKSKGAFEPKTPSMLRESALDVAVELFKDQNEGTPCSSSRDKIPKTPSGSQAADKTGDDLVFNGVKIPGIFNAPITFPKARKPEEMAQCPVCHVDVPARNINIHLDSCLAVESEVCQKKAKIPQKRDPLPKRLYHLMQDKALKKVLKDYNLSTQGDRKTLISRIQRYTVIYNSENDSPNPRPVPELVAQLEREEREEKRPNNTIMKSLARQPPRVTIDRKADPAVIEQANKTYRDENRDSFKKLIEQMRTREGKNIKPTKPPPRVYSDDEDDPNRSVVFNPDVPSTSRGDPTSSDSRSLYSQPTQRGYESDSDIFLGDSDGKESPKGLIDWNKTNLADAETLAVSDSEEENDEGEPAGGHISGGFEEETNLSSVSEEVPTTPSKPIPRPVHILLSPSESEMLADGNTQDSFEDPNITGITRKSPKLNDSSEKENQNDGDVETTGVARSSSAKDKIVSNAISKTPTVSVIQDDGSNDSIDELFDGLEDQNASRRLTRSIKRSVTRSQSNTPTPTSARGRKRKSKDSPRSSASSNLQETFDYLFEKYNGDRVDDDIESDDNCPSTSNATGSEEQTGNKTLSELQRTRRTLRNRANLTPTEETSESKQRVTRKRAKKDLSPSF